MGSGLEELQRPNSNSSLWNSRTFQFLNHYFLRSRQGRSVGPKPEAEMLSGFASLEFDDDARIKLYSDDGTALYSVPAILPRRPSTATEYIV